MICRLCLRDSVSEIIEFGLHPIVHNLLSKRSDKFDVYERNVGVCSECGFLQLTIQMPPGVLYQDYFTLSSWKNQPHYERLLWLVENICGLERDSLIYEVGCNDGSFLSILRQARFTCLRGIEPTSDASSAAQANNLSVEQGYFGKVKAEEIVASCGNPDLVVCRHVLEHIDNLEDFMDGMSLLVKDRHLLLLEMPDSIINLNMFDYAFWEEHVNYFTVSTLSHLLTLYGFRPLFIERVTFSGSTLIVIAERLSQESKPITQRTECKIEIEKAMKMSDLWPRFRENYRRHMEGVCAKNKKVAIYGCGARSSTITNLLGLEDYVSCFIDDQKEKQGLYLPGSRLQIRPQIEIDDGNIEHIILGVNAENESKVIKSASLEEKHVSWESVLPPSRYLPDFWMQLTKDFTYQA